MNNARIKATTEQQPTAACGSRRHRATSVRLHASAAAILALCSIGSARANDSSTVKDVRRQVSRIGETLTHFGAVSGIRGWKDLLNLQRLRRRRPFAEVLDGARLEFSVDLSAALKQIVGPNIEVHLQPMGVSFSVKPGVAPPHPLGFNRLCMTQGAVAKALARLWLANEERGSLPPDQTLERADHALRASLGAAYGPRITDLKEQGHLESNTADSLNQQLQQLLGES